MDRHFQVLVAAMFPGGAGRLSLTEPTDALGTGVELEARPAGKQVRKLSLLSGGERSLVALAFLFAVFRSRPSPFYVMDEVEAALDDVNLHRFLGLLHEFREEAQLIVVSHQKRTMESADALYGVTMTPGGSSKVVSQKVNGHKVATWRPPVNQSVVAGLNSAPKPAGGRSPVVSPGNARNLDRHRCRRRARAARRDIFPRPSWRLGCSPVVSRQAARRPRPATVVEAGQSRLPSVEAARRRPTVVEEPTSRKRPSSPKPSAAPPDLRERMGKTRGTFSGYIRALRARGSVDESTWDDLEEALLRADVGVKTTSTLIEDLRSRVRSGELKGPEAVLDALKEDLCVSRSTRPGAWRSVSRRVPRMCGCSSG